MFHSGGDIDSEWNCVCVMQAVYRKSLSSPQFFWQSKTTPKRGLLFEVFFLKKERQQETCPGTTEYTAMGKGCCHPEKLQTLNKNQAFMKWSLPRLIYLCLW